MRTRNLMLTLSLVIAFLVFVGAAYVLGSNRENNAASGRAATPITQETPGSDARVLTVYFSRTEGVWQGPLQVGNTHRIADDITSIIGGDQFEIVPAQDYPTEYQATADLAAQEQREDARPPLKTPPPDVSAYDVIFIGAPVWWGEYPMVVRTFMDQVDLNGKTVIPFSTHEGSNLGAFPSQLREQWPQATVAQGLAVRGSESAGALENVRSWLRDLGLAK